MNAELKTSDNPKKDCRLKIMYGHDKSACQVNLVVFNIWGVSQFPSLLI